jgi:CheY-like chemotaxis protein
VRLSVKDSGLGIPVDKLDSVFEMFGQLDRSLETGHKGLGIGLALSSALVSMHGGRITAHSEGIGTGSEFTVWLPRATASEPEPSVMPSEPSVASNRVAGCRILLVDDNQDLVVSMSRWLRQLGHDVRVAHDGASAILIADEFRAEVVLLDIGMPQLNGYEVARTLRSSSWGREMLLVAVTGWGQEEDQRRSAEAGFDRHMTKPVDPLVLELFLDSIARARIASPHATVWKTSGATTGALLGT